MQGLMTAELFNIFMKSVESVKPSYLIRKAVRRSRKCDVIQVGDLSLTVHENCYLVGFGKAVYEMAVEVENILGEHLQEGIISIPLGSQQQSQLHLKSNSVVRVIEGGEYNLPDEKAYAAAREIKNLTIKCGRGDIIFVLVSGGGSALLPYPVHPIILQEKIEVIKRISAAGANIIELNSVRKALSELKGGKLAVLAYPATMVALILSDIIGDPLNFIAGGPTVVQNGPVQSPDAISVLVKYNIMENIPQNVKLVLNQNYDEANTEKRYNSEDHSLYNVLIGHNEIALLTAKEEAERMNYFSVLLSRRVEGLVSEISYIYTEVIEYICTFLSSGSKTNFHYNVHRLHERYKTRLYVGDIAEILINNTDSIEEHRMENKSLCFIAGGEPTVKIHGNGTGGRNQELALEMSIRLDILKRKFKIIEAFNINFLSAGTDGIDGPTDAAGAVACSSSISEARLCNLDALAYLKNNDSNSFFRLLKNGQYLIKTGQTGTNVMDIHILTIQVKE